MTDALEAAIRGWRKTRHPRWAAIADVAARAISKKEPRAPIGKKEWKAIEERKDPLDLARLFEGIRASSTKEAAHRLAFFRTWDDPRVVTEVLALLADPPWRSRPYKDVVEIALRILEDARDPRVKPALQELARTYKGIIETSIGDLVAKQIARACADMSDALPSEPKEETIAPFERAFANDLRARPKISDEEFLEAIYESPDDDAPRLVYADALTERGDVRGEFIMLQTLPSPNEEQAARLRELESDAKLMARFGLPLSRGGRVTHRRGFPHELRLDPKTAKALVGERALATIKHLHVDKISMKTVLALLEQKELEGLERIGKLTPTVLDALASRPRAWKHLEMHFGFPSRDGLSKCPELRVLHAWQATDTPEKRHEIDLASLEVVPHLEELCLQAGRPIDLRFDHARSLRRIILYTAKQPFTKETFAILPHLDSLAIHACMLEDPRVLAGLSLSRLSVLCTPDKLDAILAGLPSLRHLEIASYEWFARREAPDGFFSRCSSACATSRAFVSR